VHLRIVGHVDLDRDLVDDLEGICERLLEGLDDDHRVDVALELRQSLGEDLSS
jgi:hypothetical protein